MSRRSKRIAIGWTLFVLLCSIYLLTYRGLFQSVDELAMFSMTESLVQTRSLQTPQLSFARYHNRVGRLEPLQPVLAMPLYWLAIHSARLGNIYAVMLFNVFVTSITGVVLYALLLRLGYSLVNTVGAVVVYGVATIAWPYSRSFFREPLIALLFVSAALGWVSWQQTRHPAAAVVTIVLLAAAPAGKVTSALVWPAFGLAFALESGLSRRQRMRRICSLFVIGVVGAGVLLAFLAVRAKTVWIPADLLAAWATPAEVFSRAFGLLIGSGRGLFVFSPALLLMIPGLVGLWRTRQSEAILVLGALIAFVTGYASYYAWHGGLVWGSRFLVPIVPLLMLPVTEWLTFEGLWRQGVSVALVAVSFVFQLAASTVDYSIQISGDQWELLTAYGRSPMVQQLAIWRQANFDMLWWHGPLKPHLDHVYVNPQIAALPTLALVGSVVLLAVLMGRRGFGRGTWEGRVGWLWGGGLGVLLVLATAVLMCQAPTVVSGYAGVDPDQLREVASIVNQDRGAPHAIVTVSNDFHLNVMMNGFKGRFVHYWLSPEQLEGFRDVLEPPLAATRYRLVVDRVHMPAELSGREIELWLNTRLHRFAADWVGGGYEVFGYLVPREDMVVKRVSYRSASGLELLGYGMMPQRVMRGDPLWLTFELSTAETQQHDFDLFLQLLAPDGHFVNGTDGPPQFGASPTSRWEPGVTVVDRRAVFVPEATPTGVYRVIAGFYRNGERQPVYDNLQRRLGTHIELGKVVVQE
jgi:hypothetical protein